MAGCLETKQNYNIILKMMNNIVFPNTALILRRINNLGILIKKKKSLST